MMSSVASRPAEATTAAPAFSYAQAAKGHTSSSATSGVQSSQATSGVSTPVKDSVSTVHTPSASVNGAAGSEGGDRSVNGSLESINKSDPLGVGIELESKSKLLTNSGSLPNSPSFGTASTSTLPKEEDLTLAGNTQSESAWERNTQSTSGTDKPAEATEGRRGKKGKKQKNSEKEADKEKEKAEVKQEVFIAAPPPAVNIWHQRKEAHAAKAKPSPAIPQGSQALDQSSMNDAASGQATKPADSKRRGKFSIEEGDKALGATQNGQNVGQKDISNASKAQKKGSDGSLRAKDDTIKRAGPRGSRVGEKDEKSPANQVPPPVEDAISWPTPETALEEEKRKAQEKLEKEEKDDTTQNKPRSKEKWVHVPYTPSVTFNTPLPLRGGRGRGGGRVGREASGRASHATNGGAIGERANHNSTATANAVGDIESRGRGSSNGPRAASLPPNSTKRPSSDTQERGSPATQNVENSKGSGPTKGESGAPPSQIEQSVESNDNQQQARNIDNSRKPDQAHDALGAGNSKSSTVDRRGDPSLRGSDQFRDGVNFGKDNGQARDRADGRSDRGRGGFRGRGGNYSSPLPQHPFTNGHAPQPQNGFPIRQNSNPYSPTVQQPPFSNQYNQTSSRAGRGGPRSQSIPNPSMYGRYPAGMQQMQAANSMFDYQSIQSMSATPYNPLTMDHLSVLGMLKMQLEYYFSIDNLCKDLFMRRHMDSQGFVFLSFIAGFKRIQNLTQEFELLRYACHDSQVIDIIRGEDGIDRIRRKEGWEQWVVATEERDETARNDGPTYHQRQQPPTSQYMGQILLSGPQPTSPPIFSPNGAEPSFRPFVNEAPMAPIINGTRGSYHPETPLSAAVPDFAPGQFPVNGISNTLEDETTFSDEQVADLTLVYQSPKANESSVPSKPHHNASSRTFSNGSIDSKSIAEIHESHRQGRTLTNGSRASESSAENMLRSRSPFPPLSPTTSTGSSPPVMWVKGKRQQAPVSEDSPQEKYSDVRARALNHRESSAAGDTHPDMKVLYDFWAHFLVRNFNPTMYTEFREYALEDARNNALVGIQKLVTYYDEVLISKKKVIPDTLALHYVELVMQEKATTDINNDRPAFARLRAAWRNGALDMKSRKKIDKLVDAHLKEELER